MANPEHLSILQQGVEVWNKWREDNPKTRPILNKANLERLDLSEADLRGANLTESYIVKAKLTYSDISFASLKQASLFQSDFSYSNLTLSDLYKTDLVNSNLTNVNLTEANLIAADLSKANLTGAILRSANLTWAYLIEANLKDADLTWATLIEANLSRVILRGSNITATKLYGISRDNWNIKDVICKYVHWDNEGKIRTPQKRDFIAGEFEDLYKSLPSIEYFFENGFTPIDAIIMNRVVQAINEKHPEFDLKLDSFHSRGIPHAVFTVEHKEAAEEALNQIRTEYEDRIKVLEGKREQLLEVIQMLSNNPQKLKLVAEEIIIGGDKYKIKGQAGAVGRGAHAHDMNFNQVWNDIAKDIDLLKLQGELSILREAIKREAKSSDQIRALAEVSDAETAAKAGKGSKVLEHLKKAGKWSLKVAQDIGTKVAADVIKKSLGL